MHRLTLVFRKSWNFTIDILFPIRCLKCKLSGVFVCRDCLLAMQLVREQTCMVCKKPSLLGMTHPSCSTGTTLDGLLVVGSYEDQTLKELVHLLKYKSVKDLAHPLASLVLAFTFSQNLEAFFQASLIVPVPLHPKRLRFRGFNQSLLVAKEIARNLQSEFSDTLLVRTRHTHPQVELLQEERRQNVANAFACTEKAPGKSKRVIIFDDVATTCATLQECAKVLKKSGVPSVWGLVLARG